MADAVGQRVHEFLDPSGDGVRVAGDLSDLIQNGCNHKQEKHAQVSPLTAATSGTDQTRRLTTR